MEYRDRSLLKRIDWYIVVTYLILVLLGWINIYASSYDFDGTGIFDLSARSGQQMLWIGIVLVIGMIILMIETSFFETSSYLLYIGVCLLLLITIFIARDIKGSRSWISLGAFSLQPAEFAKFATSLALAKFMSTYQFVFSQPRNYLSAIAIVLVPMLLIFAQNETGTALVYLSLVLVFYRQGMTSAILISGILVVFYFIITLKFEEWIVGDTVMGMTIAAMVVMVVLLIYSMAIRVISRRINSLLLINLGAAVVGSGLSYWLEFNLFFWLAFQIVVVAGYVFFQSIYAKSQIGKFASILAIGSLGFIFSVNYVFDNVLQPHQQMRIRVSFGIEDDLAGAGYNVNQSKIAIGSGGFIGKGFLNGTQTKLKYVPEQDTDFIFCTVGEEYGFVGSVAVLALFGFLIFRILYLSERQKSLFYQIYGYCVGSILFFHLTVNIGMVIGIIPVIGIPLPFFSYGGSSLLGFTFLLFIFLRMNTSRNN